MQFILGILIAVVIACTAYGLQSLSLDGMLAAILVGSIIFGLGGWQWAILLLVFFISSSALTKAFKHKKQEIERDYSKGSRRDAGQVLGNGSVAAILVSVMALFPENTWVWPAFAAALAGVNADTWATELGILNPSRPRLITDLGTAVEKGTSGGVSLVGTNAALIGAAFVGFPAAILNPMGTDWIFFPIITLSGFLGSVFDSLLGATFQAMYYCPVDQKLTEKHPIHSCGSPTAHVRGWSWLNNDWVNFVSSAMSGMLAIPLTMILTKFQ